MSRAADIHQWWWEYDILVCRRRQCKSIYLYAWKYL